MEKRREEEEGRKGRTEDDLWRSIMSRRDDGRMILLLKRGRAKVDEPDVSVLEDATFRLAGRLGGEVLELGVGKENILRLQVSVDKGELVHVCKSERGAERTKGERHGREGGMRKMSAGSI
jgi:hypothetical protein